MKPYTLITGASSGVGRELAIYLSKKYNLVLNGRNEERLIETKALCDTDSDIKIWPYDLSEIKDLENVFHEWNITQDIKIEHFVSCAGEMEMLPCRNITPEKLISTFSVNVFAPTILIKALASRKINSKALKSVVLISSNISNRGAAAFSIYGSSKSALDGMMRNLSIELAPNIRINSVLPGGMMTEMTKSIFEDLDVKAQFERNYPLGIGTPQKIAPMVDFLLSDSADWITGQQIVIDGGRTIDVTERRN